MAEASPLCRGKNLTIETILAFVNAMPTIPMKKAEFHEYTEMRLKGWIQTHSQIARQVALYYESNGICYPRFTKRVSYLDVLKYMFNWASLYYVPNLYTPSLNNIQNKPTNIYAFLKSKVLKGEDSFSKGCTDMFGIELNNTDKVRVYLNNFTDLVISDDTIAVNDNILGETIPNVYPTVEGLDAKEYFDYFKGIVIENYELSNICIPSLYRPHITAIKSKPFLLLAGISGTGKSRIVRELARACWDEGSENYNAQKPKNFQMVQVKPNWHDSTDLIGYVSRVSGKAEYVPGDFLRFVAKAWEDKDTPYFLCLDEMNLAPVEQYFAEYLSVIESRKSHDDGSVTTDPILQKVDEEWYFNLTASLTSNDIVRKQFNERGITIPQNLIVVGTVNMDETTFSFSRKVLDRAMTIEMNDVDLHGGLTERNEKIGKLGKDQLIGTAVEGVDVYADNKDVCETVLTYLDALNAVLDGTPFKVAYRTRNEFLLYVVNKLPYNKDENNADLSQGYVIARALDEITSMKVLSRIEGDDTKVSDEFIDRLSRTIQDGLKTITGDEHTITSTSLAKLKEMKAKLASGYTSFWS